MARDKQLKTNKIGHKTGFDIFLYIFMAIIALATAFPFYYMIIVSFANYDEIHKSAIYLIPTVFDTSAYKVVFALKSFSNSILTTVFVTVVGTILGVLATVAAAYPLSKPNIPGYKFMWYLMIIPMFFGGGMIPSYVVRQNTLHLGNSIWVMIWPAFIGTFYIILVKNFFDSLPNSFEESAKIDGANDITILFRIILPMSKPILATIALFYAVDRWNEYWLAMLHIREQAKYPLQLVLRGVLLDTANTMTGAAAVISSQSKQIYPLSMQMAVVTIATVPILLVYPFVQKYFTTGIMLGGVKE